MHLSSVRFIGCMCERQSIQRFVTNAQLLRRQMAMYRLNKYPSKVGNKSPTDKLIRRKSDSKSSEDGGSDYRPVRIDFSGSRPIMREDSMWGEPRHLDTKWLRSRDPRRYKPDFGLTEPPSLRKQFMRSPDERTRYAMGHDWEVSMRMAANRRRKEYLDQYKRDLTKARLQQSSAPQIETNISRASEDRSSPKATNVRRNRQSDSDN